jgi:5-methyltetrahydrofolate corrinoid/iron sulfur protein methyltransferase
MSALLLIGEKLNSTRPSVKKIFEERDKGQLLALAREQIEGGASCIDLNASMLMEREEEALRWGAAAVRAELRVSTMLDSPNTALLVRLVPEFGGGAILNSLPCEEEILAEALPAVSSAGAGVVIMLKDRRGIPPTIDGKLLLAERAVETAAEAGVAPERLFIDPVFAPLATNAGGLLVTLDTIRGLATRFPECPRIGGLSNSSYGLPERKLINRTFAAMAIASGITVLICDTSDRELMRSLRASEALAGSDPNCRRFLAHFREQRGAL